MYSSSTDSNTGGTVIPGADTDSYTVPTGTTGTTYYYVVVTNTNAGVNGNKKAMAASNTAKITVTEASSSTGDDGRVLAEFSHFSTYGVAYKAPAPVFTDISVHWAKEDIEFVAARGLLTGQVNDAAGGRKAPLGDTGDGLFLPDGAITRGMFVTALGRLAGVDPDSWQTRSFTDVNAGAYYAAYAEWAVRKNITEETGDKLFSPDEPVTREQLAVMTANCAGQMGLAIPTPLKAVPFADNDKISTWAAKEVAAMQRAGIVKGRDGNLFAPQENATRAEASAVLRRFIEVVIDPAMANGWKKNDSGRWLYYQDGARKEKQD